MAGPPPVTKEEEEEPSSSLGSIAASRGIWSIVVSDWCTVMEGGILGTGVSWSFKINVHMPDLCGLIITSPKGYGQKD